MCFNVCVAIIVYFLWVTFIFQLMLPLTEVCSNLIINIFLSNNLISYKDHVLLSITIFLSL